MAARQFQSESFVYAGDSALPLERVLKERYADASWSEVRRLIASGKLFVNDARSSDGRALVTTGSQLRVQMNAPRNNTGFEVADELVLYHDRHVVVVSKPEGLSSMTHESETNSVDRVVQQWLSKREGKKVPPLQIVHRLDKVTSGVMVFARNHAAKLLLKEQFRAHTAGRYYIAVAHGRLVDQRIEFRLTRDRGDGLRGVTQQPRGGYHSATNVQVREQLARCALVQCRLETGRTHQIRIHLAEIGNPIVGEPLYTKGLSGPWLEAPRVLLHAAYLSFEHPAHRGPMAFEVPAPKVFEEFLAKERRKS